MDRTTATTELLALIGSIKRMMHGRTYTCLDGEMITSSQLSMLFTLNQLGPITAQNLAKQLALTPGAVSQTIDALRARGYVERTARTDDRRVSDLKLSSNGLEQLEAIERERHGFIMDIVHDLSDEELSLLVQAHHKIFRAMQTKLKATDTKG